MNAPVLFLDVDGVLNHEAWMRAGHVQGTRPSSLDPAACARLDSVIRATGCELVLSSAWRILHQRRNRYGVRRPAWFEKILRARGCRAARFIGQTPYLGTARGYEIQAWLDENPRERFAIVDDSADMAHLLPRLVRTTWQRGLTDDECGQLVWMLTGRT